MSDSQTYTDKNGYLRFSDSNKLFHRWVMEKKLGHRLQKGEIVHHINGNIQDNRPENLELLTAKEHYIKHVVPILEARREAQIMERLVPTIDAQILKGLAYFFTCLGIALFILGLIIRVKLELWYEGLVFLLIGLISYYIARRWKKNES